MQEAALSEVQAAVSSAQWIRLIRLERSNSLGPVLQGDWHQHPHLHIHTCAATLAIFE